MKNFLELLDQLTQAQPLPNAPLRLFKLEPNTITQGNLPAPERLPVNPQSPTQAGHENRPRRRRNDPDARNLC